MHPQRPGTQSGACRGMQEAPREPRTHSLWAPRLWDVPGEGGQAEPTAHTAQRPRRSPQGLGSRWEGALWRPPGTGRAIGSGRVRLRVRVGASVM